ncbi:hypothetical protein GCM10023405_32390 [Streptomonospora salina]
MTDPFAPPPTPTASTGVKAADLQGRLLLIRPLSHEPDVLTMYGSKEAVRCTIAELDGPDAETTHEDVMVFGRGLVGQLRAALDGGVAMVLGRMGQGQAKPGQNAPWRLLDPTEQDSATARAYLARRPNQQQAPPPAAPQPQQAASQPQQPAAPPQQPQAPAVPQPAQQSPFTAAPPASDQPPF